jgi:hypothetical protein
MLHPRVPQKAVVVSAMPFARAVDIGNCDEAVRGKLLHELDDIPARNVELLCEMIEGRPRVTLPSGEIGQVRVELLSLLGNLGPLLQPLWQPHAVEKAVRVDKAEVLGSTFCVVGPVCAESIRNSRLRHVAPSLPPIVTTICDTRTLSHCLQTTYIKEIPQCH